MINEECIQTRNKSHLFLNGEQISIYPLPYGFTRTTESSVSVYFYKVPKAQSSSEFRRFYFCNTEVYNTPTLNKLLHGWSC